jgi:hypothetical protein
MLNVFLLTFFDQSSFFIKTQNDWLVLQESQDFRASKPYFVFQFQLEREHLSLSTHEPQEYIRLQIMEPEEGGKRGLEAGEKVLKEQFNMLKTEQ